MCSLTKFLRPPLPYFSLNSFITNLIASSKNVNVPPAGSRRVTLLSPNPSERLNFSFKIMFIDLMIKDTTESGV